MNETHLLVQQMLIMQGRIHVTVSKIEPKELYTSEGALTQGKSIDSSAHSSYLWNDCLIPVMVLSALHELSHAIITQTNQEGSFLVSILQRRELRNRNMRNVPMVSTDDMSDDVK